jgi:hypothetical protein
MNLSNEDLLKLVQLMQQQNPQDDMLSAAYAEIAQETDPDKRAARIEKMTRNYPEIAKMLMGDRAFSESMVTTPMPKGGVAGPGSNPFSIYVAANPLEHIAAAGNQIMGHRDRRAATKEMRQNQADWQEQLGATMNAGMNQQAAEANALRGPQTMQEWEEEQRRKYGGLWST